MALTNNSTILDVSALRFAYDGSDAEVLSGIDLKVSRRELLCILGPNGCGKTTLLKCLTGLLRPSSGQILLDGNLRSSFSPKRMARMLSYVPQSAPTAFDFTAAEVIAMGRSVHMGLLGLPDEQDCRICQAAMEMTGTTALSGRIFNSLSGGEKQTVMIARALAQQPQIMLLDEPTSSLDLRHQIEIYDMMARLAHEWEIAVVCVSHDVNMAAKYADRMVMVSDGKIAADGEPAEVVNEKNLQDIYGVNVRLLDRGDGCGVPLILAESTLEEQDR